MKTELYAENKLDAGDICNYCAYELRLGFRPSAELKWCLLHA